MYVYKSFGATEEARAIYRFSEYHALPRLALETVPRSLGLIPRLILLSPVVVSHQSYAPACLNALGKVAFACPLLFLSSPPFSLTRQQA